MRRKWIGLLIVGSMMVVSTSTPAVAQGPDATVKTTGTSVAAGIGFSWGSGVLTYKGKEYPFSISGLTAGDIGIASAQLTGEVFNLKKLEDFSGNYTAAGAGAAVGGGAGVAAMKNQNGVEMTLTASAQGVRFALPVAGVNIKLKQ